jgi:hypothetical protein
MDEIINLGQFDRRKFFKSLSPQGLGELLRSSNDNIRSENITVLENMLGSAENVLNTIANNFQYKNISRREAGEISYGALKGLTLAAPLLTLLNSCVSSSMNLPPIDENEIVHYPKLPGQKIQSPEHYGLEGCMTSYWNGKISSEYSLKKNKKIVGKLPSVIFLNYSNSRIPWGIRESFINKEMIPAVKMGVIPFITYDARRIGLKENVQNTTIKGENDKYIKLTAKNLKNFGDQYGGFFIKTMDEMNMKHIERRQWAGNSKKFKKAWKHIWNIFDGEGTNEYATWVFNPYILNKYSSSFKHYYPGDKFVDWIGFNGYNFDGQGEHHKKETFNSLFSYDYKKAKKNHPNKPIMIASVGTDENNYKIKWIQNAFKSTKKMNGIKLLNWWNEKWSDKSINNYDSRIDSSPDALNTFKKGISNPYFLSRIPYRKKSD